MADLKKIAGIAKGFIVPMIVSLVILAAPFGYLYFKLQKESKAVVAQQADLKKKTLELHEKELASEAALAEKEKKLSARDAELVTMAKQLQKSLIALNKREEECDINLVKIQQEQALSKKNDKKKPLKKAGNQTAKQAQLKRPVYNPRSFRSAHKKKAVTPKDTQLVALSMPPVAPPLAYMPPVARVEEILPQARAAGACVASDNGADTTREMARLKRKIAATSFKINYRPTDLIPNIRAGFPEDLLRRLEESDEFIPRNAAIGIKYPPLKAQADSLATTDGAREVAFKTGSQFVFSGIVDAGIGRSDYGHWVEVEVDAYDGLTGVLVAKRRQGMEIGDESEIETRSLFGSAKFYSTPFGKQFDALMKSLIKSVRADLACMPFTAKITDIDVDGNKIYIDGGATSRVAPGDKFVAYRPVKRPQSESTSNGLLGIPTTPVASLTIKQVFPLFSIGELSVDPKKTELHVGDFVSAQKVQLAKQP